MFQPLPNQVKKYFWGDRLAELVWPNHKKYIIQTLLEKGDQESLRWLFTKVNRKEVRKLLPSLRLNPKSVNFWKIYFS